MLQNIFFRNLCNDKRGFILLEILLAFLLLSAAAATVHHFYCFGLLSYTRGSIKTDLHQSARASMVKITSELRWAESYHVHSSGSQIEFTLPEDPRKYTFRLRGQDLEFLIDSTVNKVAYDIYVLNFIPSDNHTVDYQITVQNSGQEYTLFSTVKLKNKE